MQITNETKQFCEYLVKGKIASPILLDNVQAMGEIQSIITHIEDAINSKNPTVQIILSEYDEWCELYQSKKS